MIKTNDLELKTSLTIGTLTTNAANIKAFVDSQLENYTPDLYIGRADEAKKDRAELNRAADTLNKKRQELEREFNKPFEDFKAIINGCVKSIKAASTQLDNIVKGEEEREKAEKAEEIKTLWDSKNFTLVSLEKIFNKKWLNKTFKMSNIESEIDAIIKKIFSDLDTINLLDPQDVPLIKSAYLDTLDIGAALAQADTLKENRARLAKEKEEARARVIASQLNDQKDEERQQRRSDDLSEIENSLEQLIQPIEQSQPEPLLSYALLFSGTYAQLRCLKEYMTAQGITYIKLAEDNNGNYTK